MASQEQKSTSPRRADEEVVFLPVPAPATSGAAQESTAGIDDFLDEIDGVLESNAEEFVRGFVQKGGQ